jgi:hypothetical protein
VQRDAESISRACGNEDADDLGVLRQDPRFKPALGKLPGGVIGLESQPTMSRWENAPTTRELVRLTGPLVELCCASYPATRTISTRRSMPSTAASNSPSGIAIMASAGFCRSMSDD